MTITLNDDNHIFNNMNDDEIWSLLDKCIDEDYVNSPQNKSIHYNITFCKNCKNNNMIMDTNKSKYTCLECGIENGELFDMRPEWNNFEENSNENYRCGVATNPFLPKSSIGTVIGGSGYSRLRLLQNWNQMPYKERSLSDVLQQLEKNLKKFKITKVIIDNAKILYKNISEIKHKIGPNIGKNIIIRGINRSALIAACAFYGAKLQGVPRSTKEISDIFDLKLTQVTRGCRKFLELMNYQNYELNLNTTHPYDFIERYGYKLKLNKEQIDLAIKITINIYKLEIASDHQPTSLAAGSLLLISNIYNLNIQKKNISEIFGISEVTIIKTYKKIFQYKNILINDKLANAVLKKIQQKIEKGFININNNINNINNNINNINNTQNINDIFIFTDDNSSSDNSITEKSISDIINLDLLKLNQKKKRGRPKKV
jgi:transcription initiation factor TFIIIB Brf1 subunit/transcription initiation factor TFIIB